MKSVWKARFIMTDYYYPVLSDETSLPLYVLGIGARDREFHFVREDTALVVRVTLYLMVMSMI